MLCNISEEKHLHKCLWHYIMSELCYCQILQRENLALLNSVSIEQKDVLL